MQLHVERTYLVLPVSYTAAERRLLFYQGDGLVLDLVVRLDFTASDCDYYYDISRFIGDTLELNIEEFVDLPLHQVDQIPTLDEAADFFRPRVHFTARRGWINDPNGLVFYEGKYHLFYQHNPVGRDWGNMHWGHASSRDLIHWHEETIALFPDHLGTMFSGSAIVDYQNLSGLREGGHDPLLLYYTAAGSTSILSAGRKSTQCLAFSVDGGKTFRKWSLNPLIESESSENRDPKVVYDEIAAVYYMALYIAEDRYAIYHSTDLIHWLRKQELRLAGDNECPDLYPLRVEDTGERLWIFTGAHDNYLVGRFDADGCYQPIQGVRQLQYGSNSYAAQTFSGMGADRQIRLAWNRAAVPPAPFHGSMTTVTELSLKSDADGYHLCLMPIEAYQNLRVRQSCLENTMIKAREDLTIAVYGVANDILLAIRPGDFSISILGLQMTVHGSDLSLRCADLVLPLEVEDGLINLRFITDSTAIEVYTGVGKSFASLAHLSAGEAELMSIRTVNEALILDRLEINELSAAN